MILIIVMTIIIHLVIVLFAFASVIRAPMQARSAVMVLIGRIRTAFVFAIVLYLREVKNGNRIK